MNIEIDDDYADELVAAILRSTYLEALLNLESSTDYASAESLVENIPPVLRYFMRKNAYEEFMQRVKEMKEND